jgi:hypothetical protein
MSSRRLHFERKLRDPSSFMPTRDGKNRIREGLPVISPELGPDVTDTCNVPEWNFRLVSPDSN